MAYRRCGTFHFHPSKQMIPGANTASALGASLSPLHVVLWHTQRADDSLRNREKELISYQPTRHGHGLLLDLGGHLKMFKSDVSAFQSSPRLRRQIMEAFRLFLVAAVFSALCRVLSKCQGSPCLFHPFSSVRCFQSCRVHFCIYFCCCVSWLLLLLLFRELLMSYNTCKKVHK